MATEGDAAGIADVDVELNGLDKQAIVPLIAAELAAIERGELPRYTCVATVDEQIVGYARCGTRDWQQKGFPYFPDGWYLIGVNVLEPWRRRGIGLAMTIHRLKWLSAHTDCVYYFTGETNTPSMALHEPLGFQEIARDVVVPTGPRQQGMGRLFRAALS